MIGYEGSTWVCYFWFVGWHCWSLGLHIDTSDRPHVEIHLPFGFIRIGRQPLLQTWYGPGWYFRKNMNADRDLWLADIRSKDKEETNELR